MSYLYKRSNRFWHLLIKHDLVHAVWSPLVEVTRLRHVHYRKCLAESTDWPQVRGRSFLPGSDVSVCRIGFGRQNLKTQRAQRTAAEAAEGVSIASGLKGRKRGGRNEMDALLPHESLLAGKTQENA